jgi:5-methyltetrahydrofolate corrinoid/iron sulfur protein methyltransferase
MILAADNLHALNPVVTDALRRLDARPLQELAGRCRQPGVEFIDINPGYLSRAHEDRMAFMVETVQEVTSQRLILDSPNARVLARGLAVARDKPILNGLSLEAHKLQEILPLAAEHGTPLVLLLMDGRSRVPPTLEEKLAIAIELRERAVAAGVNLDDLIIDPVMPNVTWPDAFAQVTELVRTVRLLSGWSVFPEPMRTMAGLSNLLSGQRRRFSVAMEQACLGLLAGAGLGIALVNVFQPEIMATFQHIRQMTGTEEE